jgi:hypothetical protein
VGRVQALSVFHSQPLALSLSFRLRPSFRTNNVPTRPVASTAANALPLPTRRPRAHPRPQGDGNAVQAEADVHREGGDPAGAQRAPRAPNHGQPGLEVVLQRQGMARPLVHREPADRAGYRQRDELGRRWPAQGRHRGVSWCVHPSRCAHGHVRSFDHSSRPPGAGMVTCALSELPESVVKKIIVMEEPLHFGTLMKVCPVCSLTSLLCTDALRVKRELKRQIHE